MPYIVSVTLVMILKKIPNQIKRKMTNIELPHFGQIDFTQLDEYYVAEFALNGQTIHVDLNFENNNMTEDQAVTIMKFLENIYAFDIKNKTAIDKDFNDEGEATDYINFYLDELEEEELSGIIDFENPHKSKQEQLLSKLRLIRVGLYPHEKFGAGSYGVFDYSIDIDGEPCNQLLVIKTNETGNLHQITWES